MKSIPLVLATSMAAFAILLALAGTGCAQKTPAPEFGSVRFAPSFDEGMKTAAAKAAPVFLLFQEVPG